VAFDKKKFLNRFIEEARKHLTSLSNGLVALEHQPDDTELINTLFRGAHTIKGSSNMLNLTEVSNFAHQIENKLSGIRDGSTAVTKPIIDVLLQAVDHLTLLIDAAEQEKQGPAADEALTTALAAEDAQEGSIMLKETGETTAQDRRISFRQEKDIIVIKAEKLDALIQLVTGLYSMNQSLETCYKETGIIANLIEQLQISGRESVLPYKTQQLINSLGIQSEKLKEILSRDRHTVSTLNAELRDLLFELRLVPISLVFDKLPRVVRELSDNFKKRINFTMSGEETELDKKIVDMLDESLIQIVRNAIDHGIESIDERGKNGKSSEGNISLSASYEHGMCVITITDDGAGIDVEKLLEKAVSRGKMTISAAEEIRRNPTSEDLCDLIFTPGLSSRDIITDVSGRGVGMDIVRENIINHLKGSVSILTQAHVGTIFTITLPINTAIMNTTMIKTGLLTIALPSHALYEVVQMEAAEIIQVVNRTAIRLREQIIPIIHLDEIMKQGTLVDSSKKPFFLIVRSGSGFVAILADDVLSQENSLIYSLPAHIQKTPWVAGCIITGTYSIIHLLNTRQLVRLAQQDHTIQPAEQKMHKEAIRILVVDDSISTRDIEKSILESHGYDVDVAADGAIALKMAREVVYGAVVTDIEMPNMDGFTLTKNLRKEEKYHQTPIILVSSLDSEADKMKGISSGADAYIIKAAFNQDKLVETIHSLIN